MCNHRFAACKNEESLKALSVFSFAPCADMVPNVRPDWFDVNGKLWRSEWIIFFDLTFAAPSYDLPIS